MSRTYKDHPKIKKFGYGPKPGRGRYYKRGYNKAVRRAAKGGKTRSVAHWTTEIKYAQEHYPF